MTDTLPCPQCSAPVVPAAIGRGAPWPRQVVASIALTVPDLLVSHLLNHLLGWQDPLPRYVQTALAVAGRWLDVA